jgi:hypothetical protein
MMVRMSPLLVGAVLQLVPALGLVGAPGPVLKEAGRGEVTEIRKGGPEGVRSITVRVSQRLRRAGHDDLTFRLTTGTKFYKLVDGKREPASFEDVCCGQRVIVFTLYGQSGSAAIVDIDASARE